MTGVVKCCGCCRFSTDAATTQVGLLFCRRYPPVVLGTPPLVGREEWCGEWQAQPQSVEWPPRSNDEVHT